MKRWLLVALVVVLSAALLVGVRFYRPASGLTDELLAYEVTPRRTVEAAVPAAVGRVVLTSWLVIPPEATHDASRTYPYALSVQVLDDRGRLITENRFDAASRVSGDPSLPLDRGMFAARLVDSDRWVTDSRSFSLPMEGLSGRRGRIRVRALGATNPRVLVRLAYAQQRTLLERQVLVRTLDVGRRRSIVARRAALGFYDLPGEAQDRILRTWGRRLTARGRSGRDFVARRLLVGDYRAEFPDPHAPGTVLVGPRHRASVNVQGALDLEVLANRGTVLNVLDGVAAGVEPYQVVVGGSRRAVLALEGERPRAINVWTREPTSLRFEVAAGQIGKVLGRGPRVVRGSKIEVGPDVGRHRYYRLGSDRPVVFSVLPGQDRVGLTVRAAMDLGTQTTRGELRARWRGSSGDAWVAREVRLDRSVYDTLDQSGVSEPQPFLLRPPPDATGIELAGSEDLLVTVWCSEPGVDESRLAPEYDIPLGEHQVWRHAAHEVQTWAVLRPTNEIELEAEERIAWLVVQTRLDEVIPGRGERFPERALVAHGPTLERQLLVPFWYGAKEGFPEAWWNPLGAEERALRVASAGSRAHRLQVEYRAADERLGQDLSLVVDGEVAVRRRLFAARGRMSIPVDPGEHQVALQGLGPGGLALVDAAPVDGAEVVRRQRLYHLPPAGRLVLDFEQAPDAMAALLVFLVAEAGPSRYQVSFTIDRGASSAEVGTFLRRLTDFEGELTGTTTGAGRGLLWEAPTPPGAERWPATIGRARIQLGDDLKAGLHRLELRLAPGAPGPLWVRAVLVGRYDEPDEQEGD